jgi:putative solute:sodium symporter small subunit
MAGSRQYFPRSLGQVLAGVRKAVGAMSSAKDPRYQKYWKANIRFVLLLLGIWFTVAYVLSIFLVETLNKIPLGGFPLGFWFAQQGSIYVFIVLIYVYARRMAKLDKKFDVDEGDQA